MIDGSEKRNRQLAFELQNSHVCEKRSNIVSNMWSHIFGILVVRKDLRMGRFAVEKTGSD